MKIKLINLSLPLILLLASCQPKEHSNLTEEIIHINPDDFINPANSGDDWIETIKFIPLETPEGEYIPDDANLKFRDDYILCGNFDMLLIFKEDGSFVNSIRTQGKGPEEYAWIFDYDMLPGTDEIVINGDRSMVFYGIDGHFIEKQNIPLRPMGIAALGGDYFAFAPERFRQGRDDSVGKYQLIITNRQGEIVERHFEFPYYLMVDFESNFIKSPDGNGSIFVLSYDLNIYEIGPGTELKTKYTIDFGALNPDTSFLQDPRVENILKLHTLNEGKYTKPYGLAETSNTLLLRCGSEKHQKVAFRLINKNTGNHRTVVMNEPPKLGYFHGWPIYPYLSSSGDYIYHFLSGIDVMEKIGDLTEDQAKELLKCEGFDKLADVKEDDNPVLVMYKLKDF
jgi:hypothetical protein